LFVNATRKRAKVLVWDGTGSCIYAKRRLEQGRFACSGREAKDRAVRPTMSELPLFLEGSPPGRPRGAVVGAGRGRRVAEKSLRPERAVAVVATGRSVQEIRDPEMLRQAAVLLERENAQLHAKLVRRSGVTDGSLFPVWSRAGSLRHRCTTLTRRCNDGDAGATVSIAGSSARFR